MINFRTRGAWLWVGSEMIHLMELPNPDPYTGRPEHGGRDRHTCIAIRDVLKLKAILDKAGGRQKPLETTRIAKASKPSWRKSRSTATIFRRAFTGASHRPQPSSSSSSSSLSKSFIAGVRHHLHPVRRRLRRRIRRTHRTRHLRRSHQKARRIRRGLELSLEVGYRRRSKKGLLLA